jgi:hypothetical protein
MSPRTRKKLAIHTDADGTPPAATIRQALDELGIDKPYFECKVVGGRLELTLYGGDVVYWPPDTSPPKRGRRKGK